MFNRLDYTRFGSNPNRKGFNSVKRQKSQRYLVVPKQEQLTTNTEPDFDNFTAISFDEEHHLEYHDVFPDSVATEVFENNLERKEDEIISVIDTKHEIIKMKTMTRFLQNIDIQKAKKTSQKYERK